MNTQKKLILVGSGNTGKSSFLNQLHDEHKHIELYIPTDGLSAKIIDDIKIFDISGSNPGLDTAYYIGADIAIVLFDKTRKGTLDAVDKFIKNVYNVCGSIPIIIVGAKSDLDNTIPFSVIEQKLKSLDKTYGNKFPFFDISSVSRLNTTLTSPLWKKIRELI